MVPSEYINTNSLYLCSVDNLTQHNIRLLSTLKEEITAEVKKLLKSANGKITEMCKLDKQIWRTLDVEEVECKEKIEMIEQLCEEQVSILDVNPIDRTAL